MVSIVREAFSCAVLNVKRIPSTAKVLFSAI